jgi:hypothetical protein
MLHGQQFFGVVNGAISVVVIAYRAVKNVLLRIRPNASRYAATAFAEFVRTSIPADTMVAQARVSCPLVSTMQVSLVWIGPSCG